MTSQSKDKSKAKPQTDQSSGPELADRASHLKSTKLDDAKDSLDYPDSHDLWQSLQLIPEKAEIWFDGRRLVMTDNNDFGLLRLELIQALGHDRARSVLTRIGYELGTREAGLARKVRGDRSIFELFSVGPQIHALKGFVNVVPKKFECDPNTGKFYSEYYWDNSAECEAHLTHLGVGREPGGWQQVGYASGYSTAILGRPVVFRELRCVAMGHDACFLIGKNSEDWEDPERELKWFRAETYQNRPGKSVGWRKSVPEDLKIGKRDIVGASAGFNIVLHLIDKVAQTDAPVLFLGESGVGKEVFARELHKRSKRAEAPLLSVNCAAIPETLIEAELFGVEKGAFTGATASRAGRFERAEGGTLFLDEIGTLSLAAQGKLLRALQEQQFERVGGTKVIDGDVRIIAATNSDLRTDIADGKFREDLFFRLNVFPVHIPPLRNRRTDIPILINHFLRRYSEKHGKRHNSFTDEAIRYLMSYDWPGNIRELENIVERGVIVAEDGEPISVDHLVMSATQGVDYTLDPKKRAEPADPFKEFLVSTTHKARPNAMGEQLLDAGLTSTEIVDCMIEAALERTDENISEAARILGMTRSQLNYWIKQKRNGD